MKLIHLACLFLYDQATKILQIKGLGGKEHITNQAQV